MWVCEVATYVYLMADVERLLLLLLLLMLLIFLFIIAVATYFV